MKTDALQIVRVPISDLKPDPGNARKHPQRNLDAIRASLERFGQRAPLIVRPDRTVVSGNGTLSQLKLMGAEAVDVVVFEGSDEEARALAVAMNRSAELAEWDEKALASTLQSLTEDLQAAAGFVGRDLSAAVSALSSGEVVEDEAPEPPADPVTKPGDLWLLGEHRVLCGDSTKAEDVERLMDRKRARLMVTDPPYGVDYVGGHANAKKRERLTGDDTPEVFIAGLSAALNAVPSGAWYVWHAGRYAEPVYAAIRNCGFDVRALIIWNKLKAHYGAPSAHYCQKHEPCLYAVRDSAGFCGPSNEVTVWDIEQPHRNEHHPTQKPVICMSRAIRNHDADSVYDPFLGSGTTLIAAEQLGRKCYGMEISPAYCDVIVRRWENLTGNKAALEPRQGAPTENR